MSDVAFLFAGQGAQVVGMGKDLYEGSRAARAVWDVADRVLGYGLTGIAFEGPEERLTRTIHAQPAIFVHAWSALEAAREVHGDRVPVPVWCAGLSLGEYTALVAAGAIGFEDGLRLVQARAEAMQAACDAEKGTMAAVAGLAEEKVGEAVAAAGARGIVAVANYNAPGQVVISGQEVAVADAAERCRVLGAKRVTPLQVAGAYHSPLMEMAGERFGRYLETVTFAAPRIPVLANATAGIYPDGAAVAALLTRQLVCPVRWTETMRFLVAHGVAVCYEFGPGKVLRGLFRQTDRSVQVVNVGTWAEVQEVFGDA